MILPPRAAAIIQQLWFLNVDLANGDDDQRRKLTRKIAEQLCFEFGIRWGTKAQTKTHPPSKDALAYDHGDTTMDVWDWQNGSTRAVQVSAGSPPSYPALAGQWFIAVTPVDHLGTGPTLPLPPDPVVDPPVVPPVAVHILEEIDQRLLLIESSQSAILNALADMLDQQGRGIEGVVPYLGKMRLTPVPEKAVPK